MATELPTALRGLNKAGASVLWASTWAAGPLTLRAQPLSRLQLSVTPWTGVLRFLCPWDSPGRNTGVGCHALLQGIFCTQGSHPGLLPA